MRKRPTTKKGVYRNGVSCKEDDGGIRKTDSHLEI
jgi:hypothetical protein